MAKYAANKKSELPLDTHESSSAEAREDAPHACDHCGLPCLKPVPGSTDDLMFCCNGCALVYQTIHEYGLQNFYQLRDSLDANSGNPASDSTAEYLYMDDSLFMESHVEQVDEDLAQIRFYLPHMHCAACVWILERLPQVLPGVTSIRTLFAQSTCLVQFKPAEILLSQIARTLTSLGYPPSPLDDEQLLNAQRKIRRQALTRIGVAGVCAGNTMIIAIALYEGLFSGMSSEFRNFFHWVSLLVSIPAITYSASPFYRAALGGLRAKKLHIDLPVSIGLIIGFLASAYSTVVDQPHVYFDSICMLVFLLLGGRWLHQQGVQRAVELTRVTRTLLPQQARRLVNDEEVEVYTGALAVGDHLRIATNEIVPADGVISSGTASLDNSILTGESVAVDVTTGGTVFAGTKNLGNPFSLVATACGEKTRFGKLLKSIEESASERSPLTRITDTLGAYFVAVVLTIAALTFIWWLPSGTHKAVSVTLSFLVITCPCALGLSVPIALAVAMSRASRRGILIRGADAIERLASTTRIYLDKTGTITEGKGQIAELYMVSSPGGQLRTPSSIELGALGGLVLALEAQIEHPVAQALRAFFIPYASSTTDTVLTQRCATPGIGVSGTDVHGDSWMICSFRHYEQSTSFSDSHDYFRWAHTQLDKQLSPLVLTKNSQIVAIAAFGDRVKHDALDSLESLRQSGRETWMLSGDDPRVVQAVGQQLGFDNHTILGGATPEHKARILTDSTELAGMIGDGVNDAAALGNAHVGIGVRGGAENCLASADVFVCDGSVGRLAECFTGADRTMRIIRRNLLISLTYNLIGGTAAVCGLVNPLVAAIAMPLSSLTVVSSSLFSRSY